MAEKIILTKELVEEKWEDILLQLEMHYDMSRIIIDTWIRTLEIFGIYNNTVYFCVDEQRGKHGVDYLHNRGYDSFLLSSMREILNDSSIEIKIDQKSSYLNKNLDDDAVSFGDEDGEEKKEENLPYSKDYYAAIKRCNLMENYTFENFIVGDGNKHAFATCVAVADEPGQDTFNPLFIYGNSGLGKTHLIQSIAHYILQKDPKASILYVSSEVFTNDIINSIRDKKTVEFKEKYRKVDVLIIDDIQDIIGREATQQEFFNTFNFLYEAGKQIVIAADRPPTEIKSLDERLRSRFEWGVPIDVHAPDYETRIAILKKKAKLKGIEGIPEEVFSYIAQNIVSNVRVLEGSLNKIKIYASLQTEPITLEMAKEVLEDMVQKDSNVAITPNYILSVVSEHTKISTDDICSLKRNQEIKDARQLVMYLSRQLTDKSYQAIGAAGGGKDHATVYNGVGRVSKKMEEDPEFAATVHLLMKKINPDKDN